MCDLGFWNVVFVVFFCFKQKTAYELRISDWSPDVCSSDLCKILFAVARCDPPDAVFCMTVIAQGRQHGAFSRDLANLGIQGHIALVVDELVDDEFRAEIGRASCRERVCQYV